MRKTDHRPSTIDHRPSKTIQQLTSFKRHETKQEQLTAIVPPIKTLGGRHGPSSMVSSGLQPDGRRMQRGSKDALEAVQRREGGLRPPSLSRERGWVERSNYAVNTRPWSRKSGNILFNFSKWIINWIKSAFPGILIYDGIADELIGKH
jgi:hypothetical protein